MTEFDRTTEDFGNIVSLEHVNVRIPDQRLATLFYVSGLGLTRDPYQVVGVVNMWVNAGRCQFHMPTGEPQVVSGHTGLVLPSREGLLRRLETVAAPLAGTQFSFEAKQDHVAVNCPWGNRLRCHAPSERFGSMRLGMPYVEIAATKGSATEIAAFYTNVFNARCDVLEDADGRCASVWTGPDQRLVLREGEGPLPDYDGHHVAVYLCAFSPPHEALLERGLITRESNQHEYRFQNIVDRDGNVLARLEHEVRSMRHPSYARALVNRDPDAGSYSPGNEALAWALPS